MESGATYWEMIAEEIKAEGWSIGWNRIVGPSGNLWSVDATKGDGKRYVAQSEELGVAMLELQKMTREP